MGSILDIAIIIPCYNEELTIIEVIDSLNLALPNAKIYVFDNNSSDNSASLVTSKIASQNSQNLQLFFVKTQGKGAVMREAFSLIDADIYVMIDADTQYDTSILPHAIEYFNNNHLDMLSIARITQDSKIHRKYHSFGNKLISAVASFCFNKKINDVLSGYRIFNKAFVKSFPAHSNGFEIESELSIFALQQNLRIDEIKAPYKARPQGSVSKLHTFKDGFKILCMIAQLVLTERPLLVFGVLGMISLALCLGLGIPIVMEFFDTHKVPRFPTLFTCVGFGVISIVLFIAGFLASLIARNTKEMRRLTYLAHKTNPHRKHGQHQDS